MQQTLLFIPHEWFDGRLLIGWLILGALIFAWLYFRHGLSEEVWSFVPVFAIVSLVIWFLFPQLEVLGVNPDDPAGEFVKRGLAIRGYGVCLLLGIVAALGIVLLRCRQAGVEPDQILSLGFWMTVCGIAGARLLYVIQKSDQFANGRSWGENLVGMLDMTKGGLVVYGSLIGGVLAALVFFRITRLSALRTADLIAPGMVLGLAIGRIGCLMNGCCYGGVCSPEFPNLEFPAGSPPYMRQLEQGDLLGLTTAARPDDELYRTVTGVLPGSIGAGLGIEVDDQVFVQSPDSLRLQFVKEHPGRWDEERELVLYLHSESKGVIPIPISELPARSRTVHPTQIYSAINAGLLCLVLWFYWTVRRFDGEVFAMLLILYSIGRFLLEIIRQDEAGLFGSALTISQWVSVGTLVAGFCLFAYVRAYGEPAVKAGPVSAAG